jgi:hypothetical protein
MEKEALERGFLMDIKIKMILVQILILNIEIQVEIIRMQQSW